MTGTAALLVDLAAAVGAAAAALAVGRRRAGPRRLPSTLAALYAVLALLFGLRVLADAGVAAARGLPLLAGLALPLAALLVAEAIRGRHAPLALKLAAALPPILVGAARVAGHPLADALAAPVVLGGIALAALWGARGATAGGGRGPRRELALLFAAALLAGVPLALTDFVAMGAPRLGGLAVLIGLHAGTVLALPGAGGRRAALELAALAAPAALAALLLAPAEAGAAVFAAGAALAILAALLARLGARAAAGGDLAALRVLAQADHADPDAFLRSCRALPILSEAAVIRLSALEDRDVAEVAAHLERAHVIALDPVRPDDPAAHLMREARADHLVLLRRDPPTLLAVAAGLAEPERAALQLRLFARTARLIEARA